MVECYPVTVDAGVQFSVDAPDEEVRFNSVKGEIPLVATMYRTESYNGSTPQYFKGLVAGSIPVGGLNRRSSTEERPLFRSRELDWIQRAGS